MAHFAQINLDNIVTDVIIVADADAPNEVAGQTFIASLGISGDWKITSFNANFRGKYAGIGDRYDADLDEFVTPTIEESE
jgi:hypothetical protein